MSAVEGTGGRAAMGAGVGTGGSAEMGAGVGVGVSPSSTVLDAAAIDMSGAGAPEHPASGGNVPAANAAGSQKGCLVFCEQQVPSKIMGCSVLISVIGVAGAIAWGSGNSYLLAGAFAINGLASALGLFGWRRFYTLRRLDQVTAELEVAGTQLEEVTVRTGAAADVVLHTSETLEETNEKLKGEVKRLQDCIKALEEKLLQFQEQNKEFARYLQDMGIHLDNFGAQAVEREREADEADKIWDENTGNLRNLAMSIQKGSKVLFEEFKKQTVTLQDQLKRLQEAVPRAVDLEQQIEDRVKELQAIEEKIERERKELEELSKQYQQIQQQFVVASQGLHTETMGLEAAEKKAGEGDQMLLEQLEATLASLRKGNEGGSGHEAESSSLGALKKKAAEALK